MRPPTRLAATLSQPQQGSPGKNTQAACMPCTPALERHPRTKMALQGHQDARNRTLGYSWTNTKISHLSAKTVVGGHGSQGKGRLSSLAVGGVQTF